MRHQPLPTALALAALILVAACGDARLDKLHIGISRDSAAKVIGEAPRRELSYLTAGKQWYVQLYERSTAGPKDTIAWRKMSPVVFIDDKAVGWGWSWWGKEAAKQKIDMPK